jgi:anaphase-promoting complex subunit 2
MKYIQLILYNNYFDENINNNIDDDYNNNNYNGINNNNINKSMNSLKELINELIYITLDLYLKYRSKSLFEIIADYPDSFISIHELKYILHKTNNISYIGKNFRIILQKRLLHIGASTTQILDYYILLIKILRFIDNNQSSDILLYYITKPIRKYLLTRHDTIKCIITSIINSSNSNSNKGDEMNSIESNLYLELKHGGSLEYSPDEDDEDNDGYCENWEPRKRNKDLIIHNNNNDKSSSSNSMNNNSNSSSNMDTLALLVSIYDSTDLFIIEYRALLADKLLNSAGFITDHEVTNLELLKIR